MEYSQRFGGVRRLLLGQILITILLALAAGLISGVTAMTSVLLGGIVHIVPNAYFAKKMFRYQGARAAKKIVRSFYQGEALKILLSVALFALVFHFFTIIAWLFFATYILVQMVFWFAPLFF